MHVLEARFRYVGINLCGRKTFVAQELLDDPKIGPALEEMGGVGVAQGVGVNVTLANPSVQDPTHVARRQPLASRVKEQGRTG